MVGISEKKERGRGKGKGRGKRKGKARIWACKPFFSFKIETTAFKLDTD